MPSIKSVLLVGFAAITARAYMNNCQGSPSPPNSSPPNRADCDAAVGDIRRDQQYQDQARFSSGDCNIIYSTDGAGPEPVRGATISDTANDILNQCGNFQGNYGTGNCDSCHVTIHYRALRGRGPSG